MRFNGRIDYSDGTDITTADNQGMDDTTVPFVMTKTKTEFESFEIENPTFTWLQRPENGQMSVNLLLSSIDQTRDSNSEGILPPRGLSSINSLGLEKAAFNSTSGKFTDLLIYCVIPDFDFLPLGVQSTNNTCRIQYHSQNNVTVNIYGEVELDEDELYNVHFVKNPDMVSYYIFMTGKSNTVLSFDTIKDKVYPTIATDKDTILPTNNTAIDGLAKLNITEDGVDIENPKIEIRLAPYLFYRVSGNISSGLKPSKLELH